MTILLYLHNLYLIFALFPTRIYIAMNILLYSYNLYLIFAPFPNRIISDKKLDYFEEVRILLELR